MTKHQIAVLAAIQELWAAGLISETLARYLAAWTVEPYRCACCPERTPTALHVADALILVMQDYEGRVWTDDRHFIWAG